MRAGALARALAPLPSPFGGALLRAWEGRLTSPGRWLLAATAALGLVGVDTRRSQVFVLFSLGAAALLLAWLLTRWRRPRVLLACRLPERATAGRAAPFEARLASANGRPQRDLRFALPRPGRFGGGLRLSPAEVLLDVPASGELRLELALLPLRRGRYTLRGPSVRACDPLGLACGPPRFVPGGPLVVYPPFFRLESLELPVGRRYQPGGIPLSSSTGDSIEFVGTRDFRDGDSLRNIHWRSWARRGAPVVKEHQEEYFCRVALLVDTELRERLGAARARRAFEAALSLAASHAEFFSRGEYVVDVLAAGPQLYDLSAGRSLAHFENVLDVLASLEPTRGPAFEAIAPHLFERLSRISTLVAILLDLDPARVELLRRARELGTELRTLVVRQGPPSLAPEGLLAQLGEIELWAPADVERALAREAPLA
ncbi:MAG: DUF58 domain-containing protein [Vicinamibacteria bacterium]